MIFNFGIMRTLIIYISIHHQNTEKIAKTIAEVLNARLVKLSEIKPEELENYDLIGFGSGIYFWRHHYQLINLVKNLMPVKGKMAFIFSTSGAKYAQLIAHSHLKKLLLKKDFKIIGEFNCPGFDTFGPLKIFGGINKGRPNENDFEKAKNFAMKIKENLK